MQNSNLSMKMGSYLAMMAMAASPSLVRASDRPRQVVMVDDGSTPAGPSQPVIEPKRMPSQSVFFEGKFLPHQGKREMARRARRMAKKAAAP